MYKHAQEVAALCDTHGFPQWAAWGCMFQGQALMALGQVQEGFDLVTEGLARFRETGAILAEPTAITILAEAYRALGRPHEALTCLGEAAEKIDRTEERVNEPDVLRLRGELLLETGDIEKGEQSYRQAIAVATQQCARLYEVRAATSLAGLWRDQGRRDDARELLAPVYGWFTEGFDTLDLKEAKKLLDELAI
jgi:predicted ATPase